MRDLWKSGVMVTVEAAKKLTVRPPPDTVWAANGAYIEPLPIDNVPEHARLAAEDVVLQVAFDGVTSPGDRDSCVYLLKRVAMQLLHIPPHVFAVLAAHRWHHHCDRHFATHCASFRRSHRWCACAPPLLQHVLAAACIIMKHLLMARELAPRALPDTAMCSSTHTPSLATLPLRLAASTSRSWVSLAHSRCAACSYAYFLPRSRRI